MTAYLIEPPHFDVAWLYEHHEKVRQIIPDKGDALAYRNRLGELSDYVRSWAVDNFDPEKDCFVLTGNVNMLVVASLALQNAHPNHDIHLLRFNFTKKVYEEVPCGRRTSRTVA